MSRRKLYCLGMLLAMLALLAGFYAERSVGLAPCPLCLLQRCVFLLLGIFFGLGLLASTRLQHLLLNSALIIFASMGGLFAGRQIFLQHHLPHGVGECGVSLSYMLHVLPLTEVVRHVFQGGEACATRGLMFLSLNMAEWAGLLFGGFIALGVGLFFYKK